MSKAKKAQPATRKAGTSRTKHTTAEDRANARETRGGVERPAGSGRNEGGPFSEEPLPEADRLKTPEEERLENNPTGTRSDGTTARRTEPLGPAAPGQRGVPGPERRVVPQGGLPGPASQATSDDGEVFNTDTDEGMAAYRATLGPVIRVVATQMGQIHNVRRRAGDVFDVREKEFSRRWMKRVDETTPAKATGAQKALTAQNSQEIADRHREVLANKEAGRATAPRSTGDREVGED